MTSSCNTNFKAELSSRTTHPRVYPLNTRCLYLLRTNLSIGLVRRQAITWPHTDLLTILHLETNFSEIGIKMQNIFFQENVLKNIVCNKAATLFMNSAVSLLLCPRNEISSASNDVRQKCGTVPNHQQKQHVTIVWFASPLPPPTSWRMRARHATYMLHRRK